MAAATSARRCRPDSDITIVERTPYLATATCSIPAFLDGRLQQIESLVNLTPQEVTQKYQLNVLTGHQAFEIDSRKHLLRARNLATEQILDLPYHRLILATGARPIKPKWPNINANGIFTLRGLEDASNLRNYIERRKPRRFVVIGTGTIAQVCAAALRSHGLEITFTGPTKSLMEDLEEPISERIREVLEQRGISHYIADNITGFKASLDNEVEAIELANQSIPCQGVLIALGVEPNVELGKTAGLALSVQNSLRIDRHLMTSRQGIFACGDCTHTTHKITHKPFYWPLATTASRQGRQVGAIASGAPGEDPGTLAARIWTCFDLQIARVGFSSSQAQEAGLQYTTTSIQASTKQKTHGGEVLDLVLISSKESGRLMGAQLVGKEGVQARFNALCVAIAGHLTLKNLENLDLGYTPELSNLWDPIQIAGRLGRKQK